MIRLKVRYKSGRTVHAGSAEPGIVQTHDPLTCRSHESFSHEDRWLANYEEIRYSADNVKQFNDCEHTKFGNVPSVSSSYDTCSLTDIGLNTYTSYGHNIEAHIWSALFPHGNLPYAPHGADLTKGLNPTDDRMGGPVMGFLESYDSTAYNQDKIASSALKLFRNKLTKLTDISIVNSILELKDVRRMILQIKNLVNKRDWASLCSEKLSEQRVRRDSAEAYLSYKFGYCPLINDIFAVLRTLANWRKKLKTLLARVHKMEYIEASIRQYDVKGGLSHDVIDYFGEVFCDGLVNYEEVAAHVEMFFKGTSTPKTGMKYSLFCEDLSKMNVELRGLCDAFGVALDPAIVWNAWPFSFLLDWVWDVGAWLARWSKPNLPVQLRVWDFFIQWKYSALLIPEVDHVYGTPDAENPTFSTKTVHFKVPVERFVRKRFSPNLDHLKLANWDKNVIDKTLLGSALITTSRVNVEPVRPRRFGPSDRTLKNIFRELGWKTMTPRRQAAIGRLAEKLTAKLKRRATRRGFRQVQ